MLARSGEKRRLVAVLQSFAHESLPNTTFDYGHVTLADEMRLRTIVARPMPEHEAIHAGDIRRWPDRQALPGAVRL